MEFPREELLEKYVRIFNPNRFEYVNPLRIWPRTDYGWYNGGR